MLIISPLLNAQITTIHSKYNKNLKYSSKADVNRMTLAYTQNFHQQLPNILKPRTIAGMLNATLTILQFCVDQELMGTDTNGLIISLLHGTSQ